MYTTIVGSKLITKIQRHHRIRMTEIISVKSNNNHNTKKFKFRGRSFLANGNMQILLKEEGDNLFFVSVNSLTQRKGA